MTPSPARTALPALLLLVALAAPAVRAQPDPTAAEGPPVLPAIGPDSTIPVLAPDVPDPRSGDTGASGDKPAPGSSSGPSAFGVPGAPGGGAGGPGGGLAALFSPVVGRAQPRAFLGFGESFDEPVRGQNTRLGFSREEAACSGPVWQDEADEWTASANLREEALRTGGAVLPATGQPLPHDLWDVRLATGYRHLFDNGWIAGVNVNVGSASDQPFHGLAEMTAGVNASLRLPSGERNAWLFTLNYSATSEIPIPIPGVAYLLNPSDCFQAVLGFPFASVNYRPTDDLALSVSYALLTNVNARATYRVAPWLRVYTAFNVENESYFPVGRPDDRDRLFYYDDKVSAGVQCGLGPNWSLDVSSGYVFDRYYFEGRSLSDRNANRIDVGDGPFAGASLQLHF
jgi:hypothetical protein